MKTLNKVLIPIIAVTLVIGGCGERKKADWKVFTGIVKITYQKEDYNRIKKDIYGIKNKEKTLYVYFGPIRRSILDNEGKLVTIYLSEGDLFFNINDSVRIKYWDGIPMMDIYSTDTSKKKSPVFLMGDYEVLK